MGSSEVTSFKLATRFLTSSIEFIDSGVVPISGNFFTVFLKKDKTFSIAAAFWGTGKSIKFKFLEC